MLLRAVTAAAVLSMATTYASAATATPMNRIKWLGTTWHSDCLSDGLSGAQSGEVVFSDAKVRLAVRSFADAACTQPSFAITYLQTAALGADDLSTEPTTLDLTLDSVQVTVTTPLQAQVFTYLQFCGVTDWQAGRTVDITGKACVGADVAHAGDRSYDLVGLTEDAQGGPLLHRDNGNPATTAAAPPRARRRWTSKTATT